MAQDQSALSDLLESLRSADGGMVMDRLLAGALQALIELEATEVIGAGRHERTATRTTQRNGVRPKTVTTLAGDVTVAIPKTRTGSFFPSLLEPRRRIDRALHAVICEAYVHGVSTRKVDDLVVAMGGLSGVSGDGRREVLGHAVGDSETEAFWTEFLRSLRDRGLAGVQLVVSDAHRGLTAAVAAVLQGAAWQRCRVHFLRNVLARVRKGDAEMVAAAIRTIFAQPTGPAVRDQLDTVADLLDPKFPAVATVLHDAQTDLTAFADFPPAHWKKIWSTNPLERVHKEIKRRTDVVGIFPTSAALSRLAGAVLVETHDEWQASDRRYLSEDSMTTLFTTPTPLPAPPPEEAPTPQLATA